MYWTVGTPDRFTEGCVCGYQWMEATHLTLPPMMVLEHLYLGHVAVEATLLGLVLGATLSVSLGLFTVALCHYLGVARLMLALSSTEPSSLPTWMYPAFAKAIYPEPREATGKIVCANCHLSVQP